MKFQDIKTKRIGLKCEIQVANKSGHDILTTYDPSVGDSVEVAQADLVAFWDECIAEFGRGGRSGLKPVICGMKEGIKESELIDVTAPDFDLGLFTSITVLPFPLSGG